eukprot:TRINITY_DN9055_c0_g1_i1.p1 TRINITY_DN9055_c0_g1~~TRINITY_DN9055_c0_g1_i1.p1  ORF type:complete len:1722 (-),score=456.28 TRINITY_DN9055_c0_g1_i1:33-5198(-)
MQLRHVKSVFPAGDQINKVTAIAWAPNGRKFAIATQDRSVHLFDENGERRDKFSTKPADAKGARTYLVKGLAFSPDSTKLAVAQTDNMVFIYKLGLEWGEKKSICNKFAQSSAVTCVCWPLQRPNEVIYGLAEGKVKAGNMRTNKPVVLYSQTSYVTSIAPSPDGNGVIAAHYDGSIFRYTFDDAGSPIHARVCQHPSIPTSIAWGQCILVGGIDSKIVLYDKDGRVQQTFDYSGDETEKEFGSAAFSPSGECCVVGSYNRFRVFTQNRRAGGWDEEVKEIENIYSVGAVGWKADGSSVAIGGLTGAVEMYDACVRRYKYRGTFEITYVSPSTVIVKRLASQDRIKLQSHLRQEISRISIYRDRYLVAFTPETLMVADLVPCKLSEVQWRSQGEEKFFFDNPNVCMVFNAGELSLIEYGENEILGSCRTEHMSTHLVSVRLNERKNDVDNKKIAYLMDVHTIAVSDLASGITMATINHDSKIDFVELNGRATKLLFRDKRRHLHLFDLATQQRTTLLDYCAYVQWVPDSDVVVAQNRSSLCVWYSIDVPDRPTLFPIKGEIVEIERAPERTEVIVDEAGTPMSYPLDDALISFGAALDDGDLARAAGTLDALESSAEVDAMWSALAQRALDSNNLPIAGRCFAALGDAPRAKFLRRTNKFAEYAADRIGGDGTDHYMVRARLAALGKRFNEAERLYLEASAVEEAMNMYQEMHMFDDALRIAAARGHPELDGLKQSYFDYLLQSHQEDKAAQLKMEEGDYMAAVHLFLKAAMPARAAAVVTQAGIQLQPDVIERIANSMLKHGMFEKAGDFFESCDMFDRALNAYRRGNSYRRAIELARRAYPDEIIPLEEAWGDWFMQHKQPHNAMERFLQAFKYNKALEAAIAAKQWNMVLQVAEQLSDSEARPQLYKVGKMLEEAGDYSNSEKFFIKCGKAEEAVSMHLRAGRLEAAKALCVKHLGDGAVKTMFVREAERAEAAGSYRDAEKLLIAADLADTAISMYKKSRRFDDMLRLVGQYHRDLLANQHQLVAKAMQDDGEYKQAEGYYVSGGDWQSAVKMYRSLNQWDNALRVARSHGGANAWKQVAVAWAVALGGDAGGKKLTSLGLIEQAVDYLCDQGQFDEALKTAQSQMRTKVPDVHYKHAIALEDVGQFAEAEASFVRAGRPKEAVDMYVHQRDWSAAMRVAEAHDAASVSAVFFAQAKVAAAANELPRAEQLYIRANHADAAVRMYIEQRSWQEALRCANDHAPNLVSEVHAEYDKFQSGPTDGDPVAQAKMYERRGDYVRAIDSYLKVTKERSRDHDYLEETWETAVRLAMQFMTDRAAQVVGTVSERLIEISRFEQAAELWVGIDRYKEAIDVYIQAGLWDKARRVAQSYAPQLRDYVEKSNTEQLVKSKDTHSLIRGGQVAAGLDVLADQGRWQELMEIAQEQGLTVVHRYAVMNADRKFAMGNVEEAVGVFAEYGLPADPRYFDLYKRVVRKAISQGFVSKARDMLSRLITSMSQSDEKNPKEQEQFEKLLLLAHYSTLRDSCAASDLADLSAKQAVSLLRFVGDIPADAAFYQAGLACKQVNQLSLAFVFWNRFLDVSDAMEDDGSTYLDNADFENTDIPYDFAMPTESSVRDSDREDVRNWVLAVTVDQSFEQTLPERTCERCSADIYDAACSCYKCKTKYDACVVTGYPVLKANRVQCRHCNKPANRADWNKYIVKMKTCPWCGTVQNPIW